MPAASRLAGCSGWRSRQLRIGAARLAVAVRVAGGARLNSAVDLTCWVGWINRVDSSAPGGWGRGEVFLLDQATRLNATDLAKAARHLVEVADPDRAERKAERDLDRQDRAAHHGRYLLHRRGRAVGSVRGQGAVEGAPPYGRPPPARRTATPATEPGGEPATDASGRRWSTHRHTGDPSPAVCLPPTASGRRWPTHRHTGDPSPAVCLPPTASGRRWSTHRHTGDPSPAVRLPPTASGRRLVDAPPHRRPEPGGVPPPTASGRRWSTAPRHQRPEPWWRPATDRVRQTGGHGPPHRRPSPAVEPATDPWQTAGLPTHHPADRSPARPSQPPNASGKRWSTHRHGRATGSASRPRRE